MAWGLLPPNTVRLYNFFCPLEVVLFLLLQSPGCALPSYSRFLERGNARINCSGRTRRHNRQYEQVATDLFSHLCGSPICNPPLTGGRSQTSWRQMAQHEHPGKCNLGLGMGKAPSRVLDASGSSLKRFRQDWVLFCTSSASLRPGIGCCLRATLGISPLATMKQGRRSGQGFSEKRVFLRKSPTFPRGLHLVAHILNREYNTAGRRGLQRASLDQRQPARHARQSLLVYIHIGFSCFVHSHSCPLVTFPSTT